MEHSRKDVRRRRWKQWQYIWDENWITNRVEQALAIWEEDNRGSLTIPIEASFKVGGVTIKAGISFSTQSQDAVIRNALIDRNAYFSTGGLDRGWGFYNSWPIWDGASNVNFTLPYQIF